MIKPIMGKNNIANNTIIAYSVLLPLFKQSRYAQTHKTICTTKNTIEMSKKIPNMSPTPQSLLQDSIC